jgi:5-oxoprolinase (ATP-hydrolysing)
VHRYSGILSAYGLALADVVHEAQEPANIAYDEGNFERIKKRLDALSEECTKELERQGFKKAQVCGKNIEE